ncbi:hypothetical protein B4168_1028 [Anoxybacillus flavithermus]|nr:hypothetical protein B4168_1028 [Anoxybacillus flavithermus]
MTSGSAARLVSSFQAIPYGLHRRSLIQYISLLAVHLFPVICLLTI